MQKRRGGREDVTAWREPSRPLSCALATALPELSRTVPEIRVWARIPAGVASSQASANASESRSHVVLDVMCTSVEENEKIQTGRE
jgi:hypothetical protein